MATFHHSNEAFLTGYAHGSITGEYASRREAEVRFPAWDRDQIDSYLNGRDDGVKGDGTRVFAIRAARAAARAA